MFLKKRYDSLIVFVEQDSTMEPNLPSWNLVGECLPQTLPIQKWEAMIQIMRFPFLLYCLIEPPLGGSAFLISVVDSKGREENMPVACF